MTPELLSDYIWNTAITLFLVFLLADAFGVLDWIKEWIKEWIKDMFKKDKD